jgi:HD-GYP domain-containing protein (c-di-GMP phosphodiesterase class II)
MGKMMGLDPAQLENLGTCGLLHDIGNLEIPDAILNKAGKLNPDELALMQSHTLKGRDILMSGRDIYSGAVDVAYGHHEYLDGSGYPRGLQASQLSMFCKIVTVADTYDALVTHRPYRPGKDHLSAVSALNALAKEGKIDNTIKSNFISYLGVYPPGTIVELSSGEVAIVIAASHENRLRPELLIVRNKDKSPVQIFVDMKEKNHDENGQPYRIVAVRTSGYYGIDINQYYDLIVDNAV